METMDPLFSVSDSWNTTDLLPKETEADDTSTKIMMAVVAGTGIPANLVVILVMLSYESLYKKPMNMLIMNQSMIDMTVCICTIGHKFYYDMSVVPPGLAQELFCRLWMTEYIMWGLIDSSTYNLVCMSVERYMAIKYPLSYDEHKVRKRIPFLIIFTWIFGLILLITFPVASIVRDGECSIDTEYPSDLVRQLCLGMNIIMDMGFPFTLMVVLYVQMFLSLRKTAKCPAMSSGDSKHDKRAENLQKAENNLFYTCVLLVVFFFFSTSFNFVMWILYYVGGDQFLPLFDGWPFQLSQAMVVFNSVCNPFIYIIRYKQFQKCFFDLISRCVGRGRNLV